MWDLEKLPLPFEANEFDEIHGYHVLEHTGQQGDFRFFFAQWQEFWRILKPNGVFIGIVPIWNGEWAWGDPGHKRMITAGTLTFLSQNEYDKQLGKTAMADYRFCYKADFRREKEELSPDEEEYWFMLRALK